MANASYYYTLFKKFQSLGHVREASFHGSVAGIQNVKFLDPVALPGLIRTGGTQPLIGATTAASPLWGVLNAKANGIPSFMYDGQTWFAMPLGAGAAAAWADFGGLPLVNAFSNWIAAGRPMDYPAFIALPGGGTVPGAADAGGSKPFVCSSATDDGTRPGTVPANFWATSLIYLVDPATGAQANPPTLSGAPGNEYYLVGAVGNRGDDWGGKYSGPTGPAAAVTSELQAVGYAMCWGTGGMTPAVPLPSLSNNDHTSTAGAYDLFFLNSMKYDTVGFRFPVNEVFDALIAALEAGVLGGTITIPGGMSAVDYLTTSPSHVCVKIGIRRDGQSFPAHDASPLVEPRIGQRNLVRFDLDNLPPGPSPLMWKHFMVGAPLTRELRPFWSRDNAIGRNTLVLRTDLTGKLGRVHIAVPRKVFQATIAKEGVKGFEVIDRDRDKQLGVPFIDHVVLSQKDPKAAFRMPFLDNISHGLSMGFEVNAKNFQPGEVRRVELHHQTVLPVFGEGKGRRCYTPKEQTVGGFTIEFAAPKKKGWPVKR